MHHVSAMNAICFNLKLYEQKATEKGSKGEEKKTGEVVTDSGLSVRSGGKLKQIWKVFHYKILHTV